MGLHALLCSSLSPSMGQRRMPCSCTRCMCQPPCRTFRHRSPRDTVRTSTWRLVVRMIDSCSSHWRSFLSVPTRRYRHGDYFVQGGSSPLCTYCPIPRHSNSRLSFVQCNLRPRHSRVTQQRCERTVHRSELVKPDCAQSTGCQGWRRPAPVQCPESPEAAHDPAAVHVAPCEFQHSARNAPVPHLGQSTHLRVFVSPWHSPVRYWPFGHVGLPLLASLAVLLQPSQPPTR